MPAVQKLPFYIVFVLHRKKLNILWNNQIMDVWPNNGPNNSMYVEIKFFQQVVFSKIKEQDATIREGEKERIE